MHQGQGGGEAGLAAGCRSGAVRTGSHNDHRVCVDPSPATRSLQSAGSAALGTIEPPREPRGCRAVAHSFDRLRIALDGHWPGCLVADIIKGCSRAGGDRGGSGPSSVVAEASKIRWTKSALLLCSRPWPAEQPDLLRTPREQRRPGHESDAAELDSQERSRSSSTDRRSAFESADSVESERPVEEKGRGVDREPLHASLGVS